MTKQQWLRLLHLGYQITAKPGSSFAPPFTIFHMEDKVFMDGDGAVAFPHWQPGPYQGYCREDIPWQYNGD